MLFLAGTVLLSGCSTEKHEVLNVHALEKPTIVAHRGGALRFPESSIEAYRAVSAADFPMELDLRRLQDGTLVPQHDPDVDRNMIGISGAIGTVAPDEWRAARIKGIDGGSPGASTTWNEVLNEFGGKAILVPEIKESGTNLNEFAWTIIGRGLQNTVVIQSFDIDICKRLADMGLNVLYLFGDKEPDPHLLKTNGIDFAGAASSVRPEYLRSMQQAGLKVWPWTVNSVAEVSNLIDGGAAGVFTDDPWAVSEKLRDGPSG
ncbi:hypothetical protein GCM10025778_09170 [Paeniglutamicibacter antarcticus]|uniref:GP-PDE domain-containing protein n=2 Tax=Paeniglutamicibacter antarcticus TaxID=494023 RepID=A0ABP9TIH4_9MICC